MKRLIIGGGVSGNAAQALARQLGEETLLVSDSTCRPEEIRWEEIFAVVVSPGVKPQSPLLQRALAQKLPVISELAFGAAHYPAPLLAVTGTNGKTTTVELTTHLLRENYAPEVREAGNIGIPLSAVAAECLANNQPYPLAVVEVSSFQLERSSGFAPLAAVILNVASDHLDRYDNSLAEYQAVKYRIFEHVAPENRITMHGLPGGAPKRFSVRDGVICDREISLFRQDETHLSGEHNLENLLAALELCSRVLPDALLHSAAFKSSVQRFHTGKHRIEVVAEFNGVTCVNDSKATNPASVAAALAAYRDRRVHLLLGGLDKGMDFSLLNEFAGQIKHAYLIGQARETIRKTIAGHIAYSEFENFEAAIAAMIAAATPQEVVMLSPACASMDMFRNYEERGDRFRAACQQAALNGEKN